MQFFCNSRRKNCSSLLQPGPNVSQFFHFCFFGDFHLGATLDLSMLVGGNASVVTCIGLGEFPDLQFGVLSLVLNRDTTTGGDLPPLAFHPLNTWNWVTANLGDECGGSLCGEKGDKVRNPRVNSF